MKRSIIIQISVLFTTMLFSSCEDFIEKDISKKNINILAPTDGLHTNTLGVTFWWDELDGAEEYKLQVVLPSFSSAQQLILDTTITTNRFDFQLPFPGTFQWRVKGMNNGGQTNYTVHSLVIDSTLDLSTQTVALVSPADNKSSNVLLTSFQWSSLYNADSYRFILSDNLTSAVLADTTVTSPGLSYTLYEGSFQWKVRAENSLSTSAYTIKSFTIDQTSPVTPFNLTPQYGDTILTSSTLSWDHSVDVANDSFLIYNDSLMTSILNSELISTSFFSFSGTTNHFYYWRLKSYDTAGNESTWTALQKFYVQ